VKDATGKMLSSSIWFMTCVHRQHPGYRRIGSTFFTCSRSHPDAFGKCLEVERAGAPDVAV